ncbi:hypothetical protein VEE63_40290 [Escherichia coli]|nr:hypothetical protein VEE63_40290 [Escherichia coli]
MTDLIQRPRRLRKSPALRAMFEETTLSLNDLVLPIFVEEEIDDYKAVEAMPGVMRIPEKHLAREIERIANAGIRSVMTFGISHHTDETGSDAWREDGSGGAYVAHLQADRARNDRHVRHLLL